MLLLFLRPTHVDKVRCFDHRIGLHRGVCIGYSDRGRFLEFLLLNPEFNCLSDIHVQVVFGSVFNGILPHPGLLRLFEPRRMLQYRMRD